MPGEPVYVVVLFFFFFSCSVTDPHQFPTPGGGFLFSPVIHTSALASEQVISSLLPYQVAG